MREARWREPWRARCASRLGHQYFYERATSIGDVVDGSIVPEWSARSVWWCNRLGTGQRSASDPRPSHQSETKQHVVRPYTISVQSFTPSHLGSTWSNVAIGPKVSGQATAVDKSGRVLAFGGLTDGAGSPCTSDVWAYKSSTWSKLDATGGPGPRMYAASAILENALYCFGGWDPEAPGTGGTFKDEAWKLDLATNDWSMLEPLPCGAVSRHTACTVGDKVIVHTFRGVTVYDKDGMREQPTTGDSPDGLSMCTATALGDDAMLPSLARPSSRACRPTRTSSTRPHGRGRSSKYGRGGRAVRKRPRPPRPLTARRASSLAAPASAAAATRAVRPDGL